jgi:hypothetical protein
MSKHTKLVVGLAAAAFAVGAGKPAVAQQPSQDVVGEIANNTGYFVDGKTFKIAKQFLGCEEAGLVPTLATPIDFRTIFDTSWVASSKKTSVCRELGES